MAIASSYVSEDSFTSFKMSQLPKACEMLTYSKANSGSITITLAGHCHVKGLPLERRGEKDVPGCNAEVLFRSHLSHKISYFEVR